MKLKGIVIGRRYSSERLLDEQSGFAGQAFIEDFVTIQISGKATSTFELPNRGLKLDLLDTVDVEIEISQLSKRERV